MPQPPRIRVYLVVGLLACSGASTGGTTARAQPPSARPNMILTVGPLGAADYSERNWDSVFGAELALLRHRPRRRLLAYGVAVGGLRLAERAGGRLWSEAVVATGAGPLDLGLTGGPVVALDRFRAPRYGAQLGIFVYTGITPYARIGTVDRAGPFVELGVRIPLPALRW